jgi:glycosyltransferase involved in cell wall biosynthesis
VLFFLSSSVRAGIEEHVLDLLQSLSKERFVVGLACPAALADAMATELDPLAVEVFHVEAASWTKLQAIRRLGKIIRRFQPDIVHCHLFRATLVGAPLAKATGVPCVLETYHGREAWRQGLLKGNFFVDRLVSRCVDRIIAVSEAAARFLVEGKGILAQKIVVIPNGRDLRIFIPRQGENGTAIRGQLGIPDKAPLLGVVGRLEAQKGHRFLLDALPLILAEFPDTRLLLVGEGRLQTTLEAQAERLGLRDAVIFAGFQRDVPAYIDVIDVMILPSLHEGMPLTAIEAAAMAKPMVATAVDGTVEVVHHGTTGLLVPPAASAPLAQAILTLLRQPALAKQYGHAARERALKQFDRQRQVADIERLYFTTLSGQKN